MIAGLTWWVWYGGAIAAFDLFLFHRPGQYRRAWRWALGWPYHMGRYVVQMVRSEAIG